MSRSTRSIAVALVISCHNASAIQTHYDSNQKDDKVLHERVGVCARECVSACVWALFANEAACAHVLRMTLWTATCSSLEGSESSCPSRWLGNAVQNANTFQMRCTPRQNKANASMESQRWDDSQTSCESARHTHTHTLQRPCSTRVLFNAMAYFEFAAGT
eukprot:4042320-Amphidinium_carterae.2